MPATMVSKAVATDKTVQIARKFDLTLICSAHPDTIDVMCDPTHEVVPADDEQDVARAS